jgi:hypothetical protein
MAKPVMQVDAGSLRMTVIRIGGMKAKVQKAVLKSLEAAGGVLHEEIVKNASYTDHSLKRLEALDHPYAKRHGSIQIHTRKPYVVHKQGISKRSKNLHKGIKHRLIKSKREYQVYVLPSHPYAKYVIQGTKTKMLGRDFLWLTMNERGVKKKMMKSVVGVLGKDMRMKAVIRFD